MTREREKQIAWQALAEQKDPDKKENVAVINYIAGFKICQTSYSQHKVKLFCSKEDSNMR